MPSFPQFNPLRLRSYIFRLPLATRLLLVAIVALWGATIPFPWLRAWAHLEPDKMNLGTTEARQIRGEKSVRKLDNHLLVTLRVYRLNTFPLMHLNVLHVIFNVLALTPLLERFESEFGTLVTLALFTGPFGLLPGGIYTLLEKFVLRRNTVVMGASIWVFLLLSAEAMKTHKTNPNFSIGPYKIPTWTTPLILVLFTSALVPGVSLLGHLCGAGIGYLWGAGYIKFLVPHEKILRFLESKLNLLGRLPHYVSVDQKTYGRYGVLPTTMGPIPRSPEPGQRVGP